MHAACWAHARRKFHEAVKLNPQDKVAIGIVAEIDDLFAVDTRACTENLDLAARHALRQQQPRPLLDGLKQNLDAVGAAAFPSSKAAAA